MKAKPLLFIRASKSFITFIITACTTYLLFCIIIWLYSILSSYQTIHQPLEQYVSKHESQVKKTIFTQIFSRAIQCDSLTNTKEVCKKDVVQKLAIAILEEELAGPQKNNWPNDLSFVKQHNNTFYRLRWSGEVQNISNQVEQQRIATPYLIKFLTRDCRIFTTEDGNTQSCDAYVKVPLGNNEFGYMVRIVGIDEEQDLSLWVLFIPLIGISGIFNLYGSDPYMFSISLAGILIPLIIASIVTFLSRRRE